MADERIESVGHFEMLWDCPSCGTTRLLGKSQRHCANCGTPQDPDKRYFPKEGEAKQVDGHKFEGADRKCGSCDTPMGAQAKNCTNCGAPMDGSAKEVTAVPAPTPPPQPKRKTIWPYVLGAVLILGFGIWWRCVRTKEATLAVTAHKWELAIAIEKYGDVQETAWRDEMPATAQSPTCTQAERSKKDVADGETCTDEKVDKKDGTFEVLKKCKPKFKQEPVMADQCTFLVRKWQKIDDAKTAGTGTSPVWPTNVPKADGIQSEVVGAQRQGAKTAKYTLVLGDQVCEDVGEKVWKYYTDGQNVKVEVRASSGKVVCSSL